jgi:hypothetical protein
MYKRLLLTLLLCAFTAVIGSSQDMMVIPDAQIQAIRARLQETPVFYNFITESVRVIYARGQAMGNRPQVFTKMGDSDTTQGAFLHPMGLGPHPGAYCDLGDYEALQETLNYYSSVPPHSGARNSFDTRALTAHKGYSSASVLDTWWASGLCEVGETLLTCEYRRVRPSVAFIKFGLMDIQYFTVEEYRANMTQIIEQSMDGGVIPVLHTFVVLDGNIKLNSHKALLFNNVLLDLATEYRVPLINLWRESQLLPNQGLSADDIHMGFPPSRFCDFTGSHQRYGGVMRNLLTLMALDIIRREIVRDGTPASG